MNDTVQPEPVSQDEITEELIAELAGPRPALELLSRLRGGNVMDLLSNEINRVVNGVNDCNADKVGQVTLTLKIKRMKRGPMNGVEVTALVVGKAPEDPPTYDIFFMDDDGHLHANDPNQDDMFGRGPRST